MSRHNQPKQYYAIDIGAQLDLFRHHHQLYAAAGVSEQQVEDYIFHTVEQMLLHFEYQATAVTAFVDRYTSMLLGLTGGKYVYSPRRYIRQLNQEDTHRYAIALYGFAESIYREMVNANMYDYHGTLRASYEKIEGDTLYLIIRPEVPDVFRP